jgi:hypothetical protein
MTEHVGLRRTLALVLSGSLMCAAGVGFAADMGNMMNPSQWMGGNRSYDGGNSWGGPGYGYGYGGPSPYRGPFGPGGPAPYGPGRYGTAPYVPGPGGAPAGSVPPRGQVVAPAPPAPVSYRDQAARVRDLERRMGDLEAERRRQEMLPPPLRPVEPGYGPRAP